MSVQINSQNLDDLFNLNGKVIDHKLALKEKFKWKLIFVIVNKSRGYRTKYKSWKNNKYYKVVKNIIFLQKRGCINIKI